MEFFAAAAERDRPASARASSGHSGSTGSGSRSGPGGQALLLSESPALAAGPPALFQGLNQRERDQVLSHGRRRVLDRGRTLFAQGTANDGVYLVESGRIRVFYSAPSGREITLAYWHPGNFVGGPDVFGSGQHLWSGVTVSASTVVHLPAKALRALVLQIPALGVGLIEGLAFKGKCYSALAQMLGTRSVTERLAQLLLHLVDAYGVEDVDGIETGGVLIGAVFTHADLAHMVGATRQWVTISLKRLQAAGVLRAGKGGLVVLKPELLRDSAEITAIAGRR